MANINYEKLIDEFMAESPYGTSQNDDGTYSYTIDPRYWGDDVLDAEQVWKVVESGSLDDFYMMIEDCWIDGISEEEHYLIEQFNDWLVKNDKEPITEWEDMDAWYDKVYVTIDYDYYLKHSYPCRLEIDTGDANYDFALNPSYDNDYLGQDGNGNTPLDDEASLAWVAKTQGYSLDEVINALEQDDYDGLDKFLTSIANEAINTTSGLNCFVFLCKATLEELVKVYKGEYSAIKLDSRVMCGLFDSWNGGGSVLDVVLNNDITIPKQFVYQLVPDELNVRGYGVMDVYGMMESAYDTDIELV